MTNHSHRTSLRAALREDTARAGREALLAQGFWQGSWATETRGDAKVVSLADARRLRAAALVEAPHAVSSSAAHAASRGLRRTP